MQNERKLKYFNLDFSACTTLGEVYAVIQKELELPEWFGANLDALWDCLRCSFEVDTRITLVGLDKMTNGLENLVDDIKELLK